MMIEDLLLESDTGEAEEGDFGDADEAFGEGEDSAEDFGENAQQQRRRRWLINRSRARARGVQGVRGMVMPGADGNRRAVAFQEPLTTAKEARRGFAKDELGRLALQARLDRLEKKVRAEPGKIAAAAGVVSIVMTGGLATLGVVGVSRDSTHLTLENWAKRREVEAGALISLSQIATSAARTAIAGKYPRSGLGIAADVASLGFIGFFSAGRLLKRATTQGVEGGKEKVIEAVKLGHEGDHYVDLKTFEEYVAVRTTGVNGDSLIPVLLR